MMNFHERLEHILSHKDIKSISFSMIGGTFCCDIIDVEDYPFTGRASYSTPEQSQELALGKAYEAFSVYELAKHNSY